MMSLSAGWAKAEITPPPGYAMAGYVRRTSAAKGVLDPLFARALVLGAGRDRVALMAADLLLFSNRWAGKIRRRIARALNIAESQVVVIATHTHSGPATDSAPFDFAPRGSVPAASSFARFAEQQMVRAAERAAKRLSPAALSFARIRVRGVATDRDRPGQFRWQPMFLFKFESAASTAVFGIYACHSTVLGHSNALYTGDLLGRITSLAEKQADFAVFGCGAAANISTRFTRKSQTPEELSRLSRLAARQSGRARFKPLEISSLRVRKEDVFLRFRKLNDAPPAGTEAKGRLAEAAAEARENLKQLQRAPEFRRKGARIGLTRIGLGKISLVAFPFELGLGTGEYLWKQARAIPLCYADGYWGYVPPSSARPWDYEVISSAFPPEADGLLRRAAVRLAARK